MVSYIIARFSYFPALNISKNILMKISNLIIVKFVNLSYIFSFNTLFTTQIINSHIKSCFYWINLKLLKFSEVN